MIRLFHTYCFYFYYFRGLIVSGEGRRTELCQSEIEACEAALNVAGAALTQPDASQHPTSCSHLLRLLLNVSEPILQVEDTLHTLNEVIFFKCSHYVFDLVRLIMICILGSCRCSIQYASGCW